GAVLCVAFSPDGRLLTSAGFDGTVKVWDVQGPPDLLPGPKGDDAVPCAVAFRPDGGALVASAGADRVVTIWGLLGWPGGLRCEGHGGWPRRQEFGPGGTLLVTADEQAMKVWDARTGKELLTLAAARDHSPGLAFGPGARLLASGVGRAVKVWDARTGTER